MKKGFLKPLLVPQRLRTNIAMDFIVSLPPAKNTKRKFLWVIINRLSRAITLEAISSIEADKCAERFLNYYYRYHGILKIIILN